jgi:hypothetical protein
MKWFLLVILFVIVAGCHTKNEDRQTMYAYACGLVSTETAIQHAQTGK